MSTKFGHVRANRRDSERAPDYREQLKFDTDQKASEPNLQKFREGLRHGELELKYKQSLIQELLASSFSRNGLIFRADQKTLDDFAAQNTLDPKNKTTKREFARFRKGLEMKIDRIKLGTLKVSGFTWTDIRWDYSKV